MNIKISGSETQEEKIMKNSHKKTKVQKATNEEAMAITAQALEKLESASIGQLQGTLAAVVEAYIELVAECPDLQTKYSLAMAFISQTLDANAGTASLQETLPIESMEPPTTTTN